MPSLYITQICAGILIYSLQFELCLFLENELFRLFFKYEVEEFLNDKVFLW